MSDPVFITKALTQQPSLESLQVPDTGSIELNAYLAAQRDLLVQTISNSASASNVSPTTPEETKDESFGAKWLQIRFSDDLFGTNFGNVIQQTSNYYCLYNDSGNSEFQAVINENFGDYTPIPTLNGWRTLPVGNTASLFNLTLYYQINPGRVVKFVIDDANVSNTFLSTQPGWYTFDLFNGVYPNGVSNITRQAYTPLDLDISTVSQTGNQQAQDTASILNLQTGQYTSNVVFVEMLDGQGRYVDTYAHGFVAQESNAFSFTKGYLEGDSTYVRSTPANTSYSVVTTGDGVYVGQDVLELVVSGNYVVDTDTVYGAFENNGRVTTSTVRIQDTTEFWATATDVIHGNRSTDFNQMHANSVYTNSLLQANGVPWTFGGTYSNANVAAYLPTYGGNVGNGAGYIFGNGRFLTGGTYSNANVAAYLPTYGGNVGNGAGYIFGNGRFLTGITSSSNGVPAGSLYTVQFNNGNSFGSSENFYYDPTANEAGINQTVIHSNGRVDFNANAYITATPSLRLNQTTYTSQMTADAFDALNLNTFEFITVSANANTGIQTDFYTLNQANGLSLGTPFFGSTNANLFIRTDGNIYGASENRGVFYWGNYYSSANNQYTVTYANGVSNWGEGNTIIRPLSAAAFNLGLNVSNRIELQSDGDLFGGYTGTGNLYWGNTSVAAQRLTVLSNGAVRTDTYQYSNGTPVTFGGGGGNGTPGGVNLSVQFNLAGTFAGESTFTYDFTQNLLNISNGAVAVDYANSNPMFEANARGGYIGSYYGTGAAQFEIDSATGRLALLYRDGVSSSLIHNPSTGFTGVYNRATDPVFAVSANSNTMSLNAVAVFGADFYVESLDGSTDLFNVNPGSNSITISTVTGYTAASIGAKGDGTQTRMSLFADDGHRFFDFEADGEIEFKNISENKVVRVTDQGNISFSDGFSTGGNTANTLYSMTPGGSITTHIFRPSPFVADSTFVLSVTEKTNTRIFGIAANGALQASYFSSGPSDTSTAVRWVRFSHVSLGNLWMPLYQ